MGAERGAWIWYELMTPDPEGAKAFYEPIVGWQMSTGHADTGDYGFLTAPDGAMVGGLLRMTEAMCAQGARPGWLGYLSVTDTDAAVQAIAAAGGTCLMPPQDIAMAGRVAMVADPGGAPFYVMTPRPPEGSGAQSTAFCAETNHGHCGWNELMAAEPARETRVYTDMFGWSLPEGMDMGEYGTYQFVAHDDTSVGAIMGLMPGSTTPMWNHYFWVPSIPEAKAQIERSGGQIVNGPMEVPGGDWIVQGIDPQGAMFSLVGKG